MAANLQAVKVQEMSNVAEHETEATAGPMIEDDASLDTGNRVVEAEDGGALGEFSMGYIQGSVPINVIV
jgi:hypothetical protein